MPTHMQNLYTSTEIHQRGSTLLVALIMLVLLTLIAISAMNASTSSIQSVGNAQFREEALSVGQRAIETTISSNNFQSVIPTAQDVDINRDGTADFHVEFNPPPACTSYRPVRATDAGVPKVCYGSVGVACYWTNWEITAVVTDLHGSGATTTLSQGVRAISGQKVALAQCI